MAPEKTAHPVMIENARIIFRNFAGRKREYNEEGDRNFVIVLEPDIAKRMIKEGWNIKERAKYKDEGDEPEYHLEVAVEYRKGRPPRCVLVNSRGRTDLGADEVALIDAADIKNVDVSLNPYHWTNAKGEAGVKAYLKSIFVTINEDELDLKYAHLQSANADLSEEEPAF